MTEREYYEVLKEARDTIPPIGLDRIYCRLLVNDSPYAEIYTRQQWFLGPWLHYHDMLLELEREYCDGYE